MDNQLAQRFTLRIRDCDAHGRWKASGLLKQMQEMGEDHATQMGFARAQLVEKGMCWVLYRLAFALEEAAVLGDTLTMTTWPKPVAGPLFPRMFIWEKEGRRIGEAATTWVLFDIEKRRVLRPSLLPGPYATSDREIGLALPGALNAQCENPTDTRRVRYSDLDLNGHMNNARYADWICDLLDGRAIKRLQINYVTEARLGDQVALAAGPDGLIAGMRQDGRMIFEALAQQ